MTVEIDCLIVDGEGEGDIEALNDSCTRDLECREGGGEILIEREC